MKVLVVVALLGFLKGTAGNMPPTITCPSDSTIIIGQNQVKTAITWNKKAIKVFDAEDTDLTATLDPISPAYDSLVGPGQYVIRYSTKDKGGRTAACEFIIDVQMAQCSAIPNIQHGTSTCRQGATYGQTCRIVCDKGYEVLTNNARTCQKNGTYSGNTPRCEGTPYYVRMCETLTQSSKEKFDTKIDVILAALKQRLEEIGSLNSGAAGLNMSREFCKDQKLVNHGTCVFIRRYDLFHLLRIDGAHSESLYRYLMLTHPEISAFCDEPAYKAKLLNTFPDILRYKDTGYQVLFKTTMELLASNFTIYLRKESIRVCISKKGTSCLLKDIFTLVDHSLLFLQHLQNASALGQWMNPDIRNYFNALTFASILLKWNYLKAVTAIRPQANRDQQDVLTEILRSIASYVDKGDDDKLRILPTMFPKVVTDKICNNGKMCLFWRVVDQTRMYVASRQPSTSKMVKVRILDTSLDKKTFLEQKQMERILQLLADGEYNLITVANDLKKEFNKTMTKRFNELKTYFKKVQSFNAAKAKSDMIVMKHLREIVEEAQVVARYIDKNMFDLFVAMITTLGLETIGASVKLGLKIAEHCNPLKDILDASPSGLLDASADVANSVADFAAGARLVASLRTLRKESIRVGSKFATNRQKIQAMKVLMDGVMAENKSINFNEARDKFVAAYTDYYPGLRKDEVVQLESLYTHMVDRACDLVENTKQLYAAVGKIYIGSRGLCWQTKVKIAKLFTMYGSIFDKQFELIEVLMQNVQAQVGIHAADGILSDYTTVAKEPSVSDDVTQKLKQLAGMSYVSYRLMVLQAIRLYCDELQYLNGDIRPPVCKDAATDLSSLLSYTSPTCTRKLEFQSVPISPSRLGDTAYMKLEDLYAGREIAFHIPNSDWLYRNGWITRGGMNDVIYVTGIELYLPSDVDYQRAIRVEMNVAGRNYLSPGGTWYTLLPGRPQVFFYTFGNSITCRQNEKMKNPYSSCNTNQLGDICPQTEYPCFLNVGRRAVYPSIFSNFLLRVNGYEDIPVPNSSTPLKLKIGLSTCSYSITRHLTSDNSFVHGAQLQTRQCCVGNKYWSDNNQACTDCPVNSTNALEGYYCEKYRQQ